MQKSPIIGHGIYKMAFKHSTQGVIMTDPAGRIIDANPSALKLFGYSGRQASGKNIRTLFPTQVQSLIDRRLRNAVQKKSTSPALLHTQALNRKHIEFPVSLRVIHDGNNAVIFISANSNNGFNNHEPGKEIQATPVRKNSLRKKTEVVRTDVESGVMKRLFLQLLRNFPDGAISIIDQQLRFRLTGGELHQILGADPAQLVGAEIYPRFPAPLRDLIKKKITTLFRNREVITDFELPHQLNGHSYVMDAFPLTEEDGTVNNCGVIIRNITKLKETEDTLKEALKKEKDLNEMKSKFVSMASHEFRTPLSTVLSSAYLIDKYTATEDQPKRQKHVGRIVSSVNLLTDILNDFLSLGRIEEGRVAPRPTLLDIKKFTLTLLEEMENSLRNKQTITYHHTGDTEVYVDGSMLMHILMNLVSNASKFSPESGVIKVRSIHRKDCLTLSVKDQGIGISSEDQQHLMERFFRGGNTANIQGTGLGLHIVSKYLELLNGHIHYKSELGKGTEFIIDIKLPAQTNEVNPNH